MHTFVTSLSINFCPLFWRNFGYHNFVSSSGLSRSISERKRWRSLFFLGELDGQFEFLLSFFVRCLRSYCWWSLILFNFELRHPFDIELSWRALSSCETFFHFFLNLNSLRVLPDMLLNLSQQNLLPLLSFFGSLQQFVSLFITSGRKGWSYFFCHLINFFIQIDQKWFNLNSHFRFIVLNEVIRLGDVPLEVCQYAHLFLKIDL